MKTLDFAQAAQLLQLASSNEIEDWLKSVAGRAVLNDEAYWRPIGDQSSNAGAIEVSADEINPLVERVVNGMEAVVELRIAESLKQNPPPPLPASPREAIEKLFKIPNGQTRLLEENQARPLADQIQVILRGAKELPTIIVRDQRIGIHPRQFHSTIVSLGQSVKGQRPYLIGMYGQGALLPSKNVSTHS